MSSLFDCKYSLERNFEQHLVANTVGRFKKKKKIYRLLYHNQIISIHSAGTH